MMSTMILIVHRMGILMRKPTARAARTPPPQRGCVVETMRVVNTARHHDRALPRTGDPEV